MADRSISISLEAKVQGFVSGLRTAQQASKDFASRTAAFAREHEQSLDRVGKAGMVMGGGLLAGVGLAVKSFAEFDAAMSEVRASTHETAGNMDLLRQAAIDAGADTAFSAAEAAKGIDELAKAGVATKDILGGGLKGALSLAAAGSLGVGESAEIAASAMTQFKLSGEDIPHIADLLAAGAGKAQGSVQDMGAALNQAGLVAASTGLSIEEATGGLAAFASAGLTGSDAGTSFKTMLAALTPNSVAAKKEMDRLGFSAVDADGNFKSLTEIAGGLQTSMQGLGEAERAASMEIIFGSDAVRAANVLYEEGAKGVGEWTEKVNDAGYAAETAAIKQDNLAGDFEKLTGSLDSVFLKSGSGANDVLRGLVQGAEDFVDAIGDIPGPVLNAAAGIAGITGAALLVGGAFTTALPRIMEGVGAFRELEKAAPGAAKALKGAGLIAGIGALAGALGAIDTAIDDSQIERSVGRTTAALIELSKQSGNLKQDTVLLDDLFQKRDGAPLIAGVSGLDSAMTRMFKKDWSQSFSDWGESMLKIPAGMMGIKGPSQQLENSFKAIDDQLASFVQSGNADLAAKAFKQLQEQAASKGINPDEFKATFSGYSEALKQADADARVAAEGVEKITTATGRVVPITPEVQDALDEIGVSARGAATDLEKFTAALFASGLATLSAREAEAAHEAAIDATAGAVEEATAAIAKQYEAQGYGVEAAKALAKEQMGLGAALNKSKTDFDRTTDAGRILDAQFKSVAQTGMAEIEAKAKDGAGMPELQKNLGDTFNALKQSGIGMGLTATAADALARQVLKIPPKANINTWMSDSAKRMAQETGAAVDAVNGKTANIYITTHRAEIITSTRSDSVQNSGGGKTKGPEAFAIGGAVSGPGTGTSDDIVALLSNGEHVLTAAEVAKMGGQAAVYRFRGLLDKGALPKFASGGEVGHLGESANARANRLHREAQARAKARAAAEKKRREELRRTAQYRIDQMNELRLDYARGESFRTVDDSLSSAYSFSDRLRSVAASGNVPRSAGALNQRANWSDQQMRSLHAQSEKLTKSLETAKSRLQDLTQVRNSIRDNLAGGFNIGDAVKRGNMYGSAKMTDIQGSASGYLSRVQAFAGKLKRLQQMGYSGAIVQEIAEMGLVEGAKAADVLMTGTKADVKSLNKTKTAIDQASTSAGNAVTDALSKGGIQAADAFVKRLEQQQGAIAKTMLSVGLAMENALRVALGSKAIRRAGGGPVHGPGSGTSDDVPALLSNGEHVFTAEEVRRMGGHAAVHRFRQGLAGGYRYAPAAAPRLNIPAAQAPGGRAGQTFGDVHISQQSDPVATFQEFSRRTRRLST